MSRSSASTEGSLDTSPLPRILAPMSEPSNQRLVADVACTMCGCVCDDLVVNIVPNV
jgi:hypothetical protein